MPFQRVWDSSCPQIYEKWESDGASWVIQDLLPEDDDEALMLFMEQFAIDEPVTKLSGKFRKFILSVTSIFTCKGCISIATHNCTLNY